MDAHFARAPAAGVISTGFEHMRLALLGALLGSGITYISMLAWCDLQKLNTDVDRAIWAVSDFDHARSREFSSDYYCSLKGTAFRAIHDLDTILIMKEWFHRWQSELSIKAKLGKERLSKILEEEKDIDCNGLDEEIDLYRSDGGL